MMLIFLADGIGWRDIFHVTWKKDERVSASRLSQRERGIWQRRFWEYLLRDQTDFNRHVDTTHLNPVKHGWVNKVCDWPHSSFHRYLEQGIYTENWRNNECNDSDNIEQLERCAYWRRHILRPLKLLRLTAFRTSQSRPQDIINLNYPTRNI